MNRICRFSGKEFTITEDDLAFYDKVSPVFNGVKYALPPPTLCPDERARSRMAWRNERKLYSRKCDFSGKSIISIYPPDSPFKIYNQSAWWGSEWDAVSYGRDFDFSKSFFEQFANLLLKVPRLSIVNSQHQNSEYCNYAFSNKNCYLTFGSFYQEDCMYDNYCKGNKSSIDSLWLYDSELCYECLFSKKLYQCKFVDHSESSSDCLFSIDLRGCQNCFGCVGLRQKQHYILNQKYSKEEYFQILASYELHTYAGMQRAKELVFYKLKERFPIRNCYQTNTQNSVGDNLVNDKDCSWCFDCTNCEDVKYGVQLDEVFSSQDMTCMGYERSELVYYTTGGTAAFHNLFCSSCWNTNEMFYSDLCMNSSYCFGCIGLQHKEYCILNKQYSKEEYEALVPKIIEHMKKVGSGLQVVGRDTKSQTPKEPTINYPLPALTEWGEFFPSDLSPFSYNETIAQDYYPLTKEEVLRRQWEWMDASTAETRLIASVHEIPDSISNVSDDICKQILHCEIIHTPYKILLKELEFYKKLNIPIPRKCPDQRHRDRLDFRNDRFLSKKVCEKCQKEVVSSSRVGRIYCEECCIKEVY